MHAQLVNEHHRWPSAKLLHGMQISLSGFCASRHLSYKVCPYLLSTQLRSLPAVPFRAWFRLADYFSKQQLLQFERRTFLQRSDKPHIYASLILNWAGSRDGHIIPRKEPAIDSSWNVTAHGDAWEGKWRGNWRMKWVVGTFHTTSEHVVSSITTADAHTSAASSWLKWRSRRFKWTRPFRRKTKSDFCACAVTFQLASTNWTTRRVCLRAGLDVLAENLLPPEGNRSYTP